METPESPATKKDEETPQASRPSSLFPLFPLPSPPPPPPNPNPNPNSNNPQWLSNPSFTFDVSSIHLPSAPTPPGSDDEDEDGAAAAAPQRTSYDLVGSTPSDSESDQERRRRRNKKKKKKRKREGKGREASSRSRARAWGDSELKSEKDYYFDVRGDHDNLVYGSLYRMDVAQYSLHNQSEVFGLNFQLFRWKPSNSSMDVDVDIDVVDSKLRMGGRYCSAKYTALERHMGLKHMKIIKKKLSSAVPGEYIPLLDFHSSPENVNNLSSTKEDVEESWEDEVIRKTRELNKMSRDFPHDEKVWLDLAEFQDKIASTQRQKAARLQTLEKKISILEKAVELNPDNEELLLCLLKSYQERDSSGVLMERWEKVLIQHSDSVRLWKEFLFIFQGEFSQFKVSDMRSKYSHAIQALSSACEKLSRQGHQLDNSKSADPSLHQLELGLVDIFISLCRFEWQTGFQELATGLFQAEIEYTLFCPSLLLSSQSKRRLFEHFWNSSGARLGEDEAIGWSKWLENEEQNKHNTFAEEISQETEVGGWTGWSDPSSKKTSTGEELDNPEHALDNEQIEEDLENGDDPQVDDIEALLKKLGVNVDAEPHTEVKDVKTWKRWSEEELSRDSVQWMPIREHHEGNLGKFGSLHPKGNQDIEGNEQLSRVILFEDVNNYLFPLCTEEARFSLVSQFIDFFSGKISPWTCSNNSSWIEKLLSLETVPDSFAEDLRVILQVANSQKQSEVQADLDLLFGSTNKLLRDNNVMKFLRNAILLLLEVFPRNHILEEALLDAEELFVKSMNSTCLVNPSRALAKGLLKNDRQDLLLCGVYAKSEYTYGNIDAARKILDLALLSADGLPPVQKEYIPLLYFWYAEMEMKICSPDSNSESAQRAVHILSCLGSNAKYVPFKCQPSGLQILRARQGFKEQSKALRSTWARGEIKEYSVAFICAAALFESMTSGLIAGIEIIEEAFSTVLPERRSKSLQLEFLWIYFIGMLRKHLKKLKFSRVWESIVQGLQLYPFNLKTFTCMAEVSYLFTVPHKVRRTFDECSQRKPSVILWLVALSYELSKLGSQHRIHGLFEKALSNDRLQKSVLLWRCYLAYEADIAHNPTAARRIFFRAIHACPWSKRLWLDGFQKLSSILTAAELSDLQEVMRDKELNLRTDIYEILLQDETEP